MKILYIICSVNPAGGGPVEGVKNIGGTITNMGHTTEVVTLDAPDAPWLKEFPLPVYALGPAKGAYAYCPNLVRWLEKHYDDYDACVVNGVWQYNGFAAWTVLRDKSVPYFVFTHGMLDPWFKHAYALKHLKKVLYWPIQHKILQGAAAVCFTTEEEKILARESFRPYSVVEKVVSYGTKEPGGVVEEQKEAFYSLCPEARGKTNFLFLSRIHEKKGCDILIKAFAETAAKDPESRLIIAGPDKHNLRPMLEGLAEQLGVSKKISWPGMVSGNLKWGAFHVADAFVLPSHQENFGIAVAEALACGCPVIISNKVNIWREIESDGAGIVGSDDLIGTAASLNRWIALSAGEKSKMRENALASFYKRFEIRRAAESLIDLVGQPLTKA